MELEKKVKIGNDSYLLKLPTTFSESMRIDQLKIDYSDGMYWELPKLSTPSAVYNWQLINVASYFDVMASAIVKEIAGGKDISVLELDFEKQKVLMDAYNEHIHQWLSDYENIYIKIEDNEKEGEEK